MTLRDDYARLFLPTYAPPKPVLTRGNGAFVWDTEGREYIDFGGGIAVLSLGTRRPRRIIGACRTSRPTDAHLQLVCQ